MASYDRLMDPQALLQRIVYGRPAPLLRKSQRMDTPFFGRLFDELANSHAVLVRVARSETSGHYTARKLNEELPTELYAITVKQDPEVPVDDEWFVIVYNRVTRTVAMPAWHHTLAPTQEWVDTCEAARILRVSRDRALKLAHQYGAIADHRVGGRNQVMIRRTALVEIANRPRQRKRKAVA